MMYAEFEKCRSLVEQRLNEYFVNLSPQQGLFESMRYSLLSGGKRIRPILVLKFCAASGGRMEDAMAPACAVEMLHTYSLIHDDLPCMDNDDLRRGRLTNHKVYGEWNAVLAGDALQAAAFETILSSSLQPKAKTQAALELALAAGENGICGGQYLDINGEEKTLTIDEVTTIHSMKTAAMIKAAAKIGVIAGHGTKEQLEAAEKYAQAVGVAFQIRDDILDYVSTTEVLGKPVGSDKESGKNTFASVLGIDECEKIISQKTVEAEACVKDAFEKPEFLIWLAEMLAKRKY